MTKGTTVCVCMYVTIVAFAVSPSAMYPVEFPRSSKVALVEDRDSAEPNRQVLFPAGSQSAGISTHSFEVPHPSRVMFTWQTQFLIKSCNVVKMSCLDKHEKWQDLLLKLKCLLISNHRTKKLKAVI